MKKNKEEIIEKNIIDEFYKLNNNSNEETKILLDINDNLYAEEFKQKMELSLNEMDTLKYAEFDLDVDISEIINKADQIKGKNKYKIETVGFILTASSILLIFILLSLKIGKEFVLYTQILSSFILPFILIPISKYSKATAREE